MSKNYELVVIKDNGKYREISLKKSKGIESPTVIIHDPKIEMIVCNPNSKVLIPHHYSNKDWYNELIVVGSVKRSELKNYF